VIFSPGTQTTLGGGFSQPQSVAVDGSGNVFVADTTLVKEIPAGCVSTGCVVTRASSFSFTNLPGIAVDGSGNVFVADYGVSKVYEILAAGGYTTVNTLGAGFSFNTPTGVAVDGSGNIFVADDGNNAVEEILAAGGYITVKTLGGGFSAPQGVAVDARGNIYVADTSNNAVKQIPPGCGSASCVTTLGGGFNGPAGVMVDGNGNIYIGDTNNGAVKQMPAVCGSASCVATLGSGFSLPQGVAADGSGNVFISDTGDSAVVKLDFADAPSLSFASTAVGSTSGDSPQAVTMTNIGNASLTFPLPATGLNPSIAAGFTIGSSSTCPQLSSSSTAATLAPGASCTNLISFTPTAVGSIGGSLFMTDDHLNAAAPGYATQSTALSGTATVGTPTITFSVSDHTFGDAAFPVTATSNSTGALTYTVVSGPATISGSTVTLTGAGTVVLQAAEAADSNYTAATQNATFTVGAGTPTISFTVANHTFGDAAFPVTATSDSTGALTYTVVSGPATIAGSTVTLTGAGTVLLQAAEAADSNYTASTQNASFTIAAAAPAIAFTVPNHTYGDAPFTVGATSNSTGALTYTVVSGLATVSGSTVTLTGAGTVVLQAAEAADSNYTVATQNATFTVAAIAPTINFTVPNHAYGDAPFMVSATSNSTGAFTYTVVSGPGTISGSTVTLTGAGTVVLQASQVADTNYLAATQNATFTVATGTPTVSFIVPNHSYGDADFTVSATSNSTGAFTYSVLSGPATIVGSTVTLTGAGTVVLQASQAADTNYLAATQNATFTVATITPTILFVVPNHTYGDAPFTVSAVSKSTGAYTYTVISGPATIAGSTITLTGAGTVMLQASQAADTNYAAATQNVTFTVAGITPTILFTVANHTYGDAPFSVNATSNSSGAFTYSVLSGPATIAGSTVTLTGSGMVELQASEAASGNYDAATKNTTFAVAAVTPTISFTIANHTYGDAPFTVSATSNSTAAFIYTMVSGPATISGSTVTLTGVGTVVLSASQAGSGNYTSAAANTSFTVATGLTLSSGSGTGSNSGSATVAPGAAATFTIALAPGGSATYPDAVTFSASGLPAGATGTFSPATIPAGSGATSVTFTIQTSSQTAHIEKPLSGRPFGAVALGFLLLPLAGIKMVRRRSRQMPRLTVGLAVMLLSLGALLGLSGCGGSSAANQTAKSYTVVVTATDVSTGAHASTNVTLNVQ
jgi:sugar lactone lactonase YvrE